MNIQDVVKNRYTVKAFDANKTVSEEDMEKVKTLLQYSPSSTNLQPWHFIIAGSEEGKKRVAKATEGFFHFNSEKVLKASHVVVFCSRTAADPEYMNHLLEKEDQDGRYPNEDVKNSMHGGRNLFADIHRYDVKDFQHWMEKQVYLNIGNFLLGVAALGVDAVPMEGIDFKKLDEEFGLREKGFTSITVVAIGYRSEDDFNSPEKTPKSRLSQEEILTLV
ncbi:MAG: oxygen-insensitive NAD(P)H nitroreductase [Bacteroidota bacterium]